MPAWEASLCSLVGITHISDTISRCCKHTCIWLCLISTLCTQSDIATQSKKILFQKFKELTTKNAFVAGPAWTGVKMCHFICGSIELVYCKELHFQSKTEPISPACSISHCLLKNKWRTNVDLLVMYLMLKHVP